MVNGKVQGNVKYYYLNGGLKSESIFKPRSRKIIANYYYENGKKRMFSQSVNNQYSIIKWYNLEGRMVKLEKKTKTGKKTYRWYDNGKLASVEKYVNGEPIGCVIIIDSINGEGIEREGCYCGNKLVKWQDNLYVDVVGQVVNKNYRYKNYEYFESGRKKSMTKQKGLTLKRKEWDKNGRMIADTMTGIKVAPFYSLDTGRSTLISKNDQKGWPILKTKNPLRDTLIQASNVYSMNDTLIQYKFSLTFHDSLGQERYWSMEGTALKYDAISGKYNEKTGPYLAQYEIFSIGYEGEFFLAIGIKRNDPKVIILIANKGYHELLVLNKELRINN